MSDVQREDVRYGTCPVCEGRFRVTAAGEMRAHGKPANRCPGSGSDPLPSILIRDVFGRHFAGGES